MRKVAWLAAVVTLISSGFYVFLYLYRWEWHRALLVGVLFLVAEVAFATALILSRIRRPEPAGDVSEPEQDPFSETPGPPERRPEFAWLRGDGGFGVFIPVLLGSGVLVSAVAWAVERLAARGSRRAAARGLAKELAPLTFPDTLLVDHPELPGGSAGQRDQLDLLVRPRRGPDEPPRPTRAP